MKSLRIVLDCETTGLAHNDPGGGRPDGIISIGISWSEDGGKTVSSTVFEANPCLKDGFDYLADGRAAAALKVNGYTESQVRKLPPASEVTDKVHDFLVRLAKRHGVLSLTTFNVEFDRPLLDAAPWNLTGRLVHEGGPFASWEECVMLRAIRVLKVGNNGRLPLARALREAGLDYDGAAHDAAVDARAALRLAYFLDEKERGALVAEGSGASPAGSNADETEAHDFLDALGSPDAPPMPGQMGSVRPFTGVSPSQLGMCLKKLWLISVGQASDDDYREWQESRGMVGSKLEDVFFEKCARGSIAYIRGEYVIGSDIRGRLDGRYEWPRGSGKWNVVEVKSTVTKMEKVLREPLPDHLLQFECYARLSGYGRILVAVGGLGYGEHGKWAADFYRQNDATWAKVLARVATIKSLWGGKTIPPCSCGRCAP